MAINNAYVWDEQIRTSVSKQNLPWYRDQVGIVDYTNASERFAVNATWLYGLKEEQDPATGLRQPKPTLETEALIVQRGSGDGVIGSWSGVSGYVDRVHAPDGQPLDRLVIRTIEDEFREEGNVAEDDLAYTTWRADRHNVWPTHIGRLVVLPMIGVYNGPNRPIFTPDGTEVVDYAWVPLGRLRERPQIAEGYLSHTLTTALGTVATQHVVRMLIGDEGVKDL